MNKIPAQSVLLTTCLVAALLLFGCKKDAPLTLPELNISSISNITKSSATVAVYITSGGNGTITESGICYSTTPNPDITKTKVINAASGGKFTCVMSGLLPNTTYYVMAYAINEKGIAYGNELSLFTSYAKFMIPDLNFRACLKMQFPTAFDTKDSLKYSDPSISGFNGTINASGLNIVTLSGIEYFPALTQLNCSYNPLTSIDLTHNKSLKSLMCNNNKLASLDISKSTALTNLICSFNLLTNIDASKNIALVNLFCDNNLLTGLDLSKNTVLGFLDCTANQLTSLDLTQNTALYSLSCTNNQLTTLNISTQTSFSSNLNIIQDVFQVYIGNTGLTTLKVNDAVKQNPEILNIKQILPACIISTWNNAVQICPNYNPITNTCP